MTGEQIDGKEFLAAQGLTEIESLRIEAHGQVYEVFQGIEQCPPFAKFVTGLAASLETLPKEQATEIMANSIRTMAVESPDSIEPKKKLNQTNLFSPSQALQT